MAKIYIFGICMTCLVLSLVISNVYSNDDLKWVISNPYENVNWSSDQFYKGNLHTHTTLSDGHMNPQTVVDKYDELDYDILAITDHNRVSYPWTKFSEMQPDERAKRYNRMLLERDIITDEALVNKNRDPAEGGMVAIEGNELSFSSGHHHINSFFSSDWGASRPEVSLQGVADDNGLAVWNHPMSARERSIVAQLTTDTVGWYIDMYRRFDHLIGQEVNNSERDHVMWDSTLTVMMPDRPIWGFSNDDMHSLSQLGFRWNVFVLPELSKEWVRRGMEEGRFFFVLARQGHNGPSPPVIDSIRVDQQSGTIHIHSTGYESMEWISAGRVVHDSHVINLNELPEVGSYVRAVFYGKDRNTYIGTQPFGVQRVTSGMDMQGRVANPAPLKNVSSDANETVIDSVAADERPSRESDPKSTPGKGVTDIDGNEYETIIIGDQEWMTENLRVTHYRDSTPIDYPGKDYTAWQQNKTAAYAWYDHDKDEFKETYGALYNWRAVINEPGLCPADWRVPSDNDWKKMEIYFGMSKDDAHLAGWWRGNKMGDLLKNTCTTAGKHPCWKESEESRPTNESGFSAVPGGYRTSHGYFAYIGSFGHWWSSTEYSPAFAWSRRLEYNYTDVTRFAVNKVYGYSVRCMRDSV